MLARLRKWWWEWMRAWSQVLGCWLRGWAYVWFGVGDPDADETTSSWVGRNAMEGNRWALIAEKMIDALFGSGHCRRAAGRRE